MRTIISQDHKNNTTQIIELITLFETRGEILGNASRNRIKVFDLNGKKINIKSFQIPNPINKVAYRFFRKSKAQRSFEYAQKLISKNIGTPQPIAYVEETTAFGFKRSFYVCEQLDCELTFRDLVTQPNYPQHEEILRAFARFTFKLHEKNIKFLDHSPGNTLIQLNSGNFQFFLVDLNRMNFGELNFDARMKNFSRLTPKKEMIRIMANEYSKLYKKSEQEVFDKMWFYTNKFQKKYFKKKRLKQKIKNKLGI